jgi:hypothetical protein
MPINTTFGIYIYKRKYGEGWSFWFLFSFGKWSGEVYNI